MNKRWIIEDWAGNKLTHGHFASFEDAEDYLSAFLGEEYDDTRQEYEVVLDADAE